MNHGQMTHFQHINVQRGKLRLGKHNYSNNARWLPINPTQRQ